MSDAVTRRTAAVVEQTAAACPPQQTRPAAKQAPAPAPAPAPANPRDNVQVRNNAAHGTAVASVTLGSRQQPVDFRQMLPGFRSGSSLDVDATGAKGWVVGGDGRITSLTSNSLKMSLHVTAPGVDERLNVDLRASGGGYRLHAPENWPVSIEKHGAWYRLTNLDNPKQYIELRSTGSGEAEIRTKGMKGVDGTTLTIEVD